MKELLMKLLVEHGDREFGWAPHWGKLVSGAIHQGFIDEREAEIAPEWFEFRFKITPKGLEYLKNNAD